MAGNEIIAELLAIAVVDSTFIIIYKSMFIFDSSVVKLGLPHLCTVLQHPESGSMCVLPKDCYHTPADWDYSKHKILCPERWALNLLQMKDRVARLSLQVETNNYEENDAA